MAPEDANRLGIKEGDEVEIRSGAHSLFGPMRLRTFLKPGVVGEARGVGAKDRGHSAMRGGRCPSREFGAGFCDGLRSHVGDHAVEERLAPAPVEVLLSPARPPSSADPLIVASMLLSFAGQRREKPMGAVGLVQGPD